MKRWLAWLTGRRSPAAIPTVDYYFMGAVGDLVSDGSGASAGRPVRRFGPYAFASQSDLVIIRYATPQELREIEGRRWRNVYYVIDDMIPVAADCMELPPEYRSKLSRFNADVLPRILALDPTIVAPSPAIRELFAGRPAEHLDPCALTIAGDLSHFEQRAVNGGPLRLAFLGTRSHGAGIDFLGAVMDRVAAAGAEVRLTHFLGRHEPKQVAKLANVDNRPPLDWLSFREFLARERFHVLLSPLPDTPFNAGRSITKLLDAAAVGACGLYSDRRPFSEAVTPGRDGVLIGDDPQAWADQVVEIGRDLRAARGLAAAGGDLARRRGDPARVRQFWVERLGLERSR